MESAHQSGGVWNGVAQRHPVLQALRSQLRPGQQRMADWQGGPLAVSAVPGSGKSTGMAIAAALLLAQRYEQPHEPTTSHAQLVLVTFTRSAAANLKAKIRQSLTQLSLPPQGFAVYTLHGLALTIANRHPELSQLDLERMTLVSPNQSNRLIRTCVEQWIAQFPQRYAQLLEGVYFDGEETERLRRQSVLRTEVLPALAYTVIHEAKSSGLSPEDLEALSQAPIQSASPEEAAMEYNVLAIAAGLYRNYQILLQQRGFIDYDDMILAALRVLDNGAARQFWQSHWFAVFEDEAQDSSPLQTRLLERLATDPQHPQHLNLVRVGDPNQAINSTFTPADPIFFRTFCEQCQHQGRLAEMDQAGRSSRIIMDAANFLLDWVNQHYTHPPTVGHPVQQSEEMPRSPFRPQHIHPVGADDPQPDANPAPVAGGLAIRYPSDIIHSVDLIGRQVVELLSRYPKATAAVLVRENRQGRFVAEALRNPGQFNLEVNLSQHGIEVYDVGQRDRYSHVPAEMLALLQFLDRPHSPDNLKAALAVLVNRQLLPSQDLNAIASQPEQFLYPGPLDPAQSAPALQAQQVCTDLLQARLELPPHQLIPYLALTLNYDQTELATADKLAVRLSQQTASNPAIATILEVLSEIVRSEQFDPVETDDPESRYTRAGQLTIITMHKAKGLDWDFVFIPFLHESTIPGRLWIPPQMQFLGDINLADVARAQIRSYIHGSGRIPNTKQAWQQAGFLKLAEEFRLLYVAMTRAKRLLWMSAERQAPFTWNKPDSLEEKTPCPFLPALSQRITPIGRTSTL